MNILKYLLAGLVLLNLSSCINMLEELSLNKDGSGTYSITFDMSGLFSDPMMKGMMEEMLQSEEGLKLGKGLSEEMDTVIRFSDMPADARQKLDRPEFWEKVAMHIVMSETKKKMETKLSLEFSSAEDIAYFYKNLDKLSLDEESGMTGGGMSEFMPAAGLFKVAKRKLQRLPAPKVKNMVNEEEMAMVKMFFATATYKTVYHLPGKVKKTSIPGARVDGKMVTVSNSFLEVMDGKAVMDGEIKFGKK